MQKPHNVTYRHTTAALERLAMANPRNVIPGRRLSGEPGIWKLLREIPGSPFGRPGMTSDEH
jgi:hypothetical protein